MSLWDPACRHNPKTRPRLRPHAAQAQRSHHRRDRPPIVTVEVRNLRPRPPRFASALRMPSTGHLHALAWRPTYPTAWVETTLLWTAPQARRLDAVCSGMTTRRLLAMERPTEI